MLCSHICYAAQSPRLLGKLKKENKPKTGKQNLPKLNCDPPSERNAFLEKPDGKVLKAVSVQTKVCDCIRELLRLKADCYRNIRFNVYLMTRLRTFPAEQCRLHTRIRAYPTSTAESSFWKGLTSSLAAGTDSPPEYDGDKAAARPPPPWPQPRTWGRGGGRAPAAAGKPSNQPGSRPRTSPGLPGQPRTTAAPLPRGAALPASPSQSLPGAVTLSRP